MISFLELIGSVIGYLVIGVLLALAWNPIERFLFQYDMDDFELGGWIFAWPLCLVFVGLFACIAAIAAIVYAIAGGIILSFDLFMEKFFPTTAARMYANARSPF
jgi:hypothetical protein